MSKAKKLAADFGIGTADSVEPPDRTPKGKKIAWTLTRRMVFKVMEPVALSLVATDGPVTVKLENPDGTVKRHIGHNRSVWGVRMVNSAVWRDTPTTAWDRNPYMRVRTQFRLWLRTSQERDRLLDDILEYLGRCAEADGGMDQLEHGFFDMGPSLSLDRLEKTLHEIAQGIGVPTWTDEGLVEWFDTVSSRARDICAEKGWKISNRLIEGLMENDLVQFGRS